MSKYTYIGGDLIEWIGGTYKIYAKEGYTISSNGQIIFNAEEGEKFGEPEEPPNAAQSQADVPAIYILVAGVGFPHTNHLTVNNEFGGILKGYEDSLLLMAKKQSNSSKNICIITVDIFTGKIEKIGNLNETLWNKISQLKCYPISMNNYTSQNGYSFKTVGSKEIISKNDVYNIIKEIATLTSCQNSLIEISIFSHANNDGPILVNSMEYIINNGKTEENKDDHDMRLSDLGKGLFTPDSCGKAFQKDAVLKIWGCSFPRLLHYFFSLIFKDNNYKTDGSTSDDTRFVIPPSKFKLIIDNKEGNIITDIVNPSLATNYPINKPLELSMLQIKKVAAAQYFSTYAAQFTLKFKVKSIAALPATYALPEKDKFTISSDTLNAVKFYKTYLNVKVDEQQYGIYDNETIEHIRSIRRKQ